MSKGVVQLSFRCVIMDVFKAVIAVISMVNISHQRSDVQLLTHNVDRREHRSPNRTQQIFAR